MAIKAVLLALLALSAVVSGFAPASPCSCLADEAQFEAVCESVTDPTEVRDRRIKKKKLPSCHSQREPPRVA